MSRGDIFRRAFALEERTAHTERVLTLLLDHKAEGSVSVRFGDLLHTVFLFDSAGREGGLLLVATRKCATAETIEAFVWTRADMLKRMPTMHESYGEEFAGRLAQLLKWEDPSRGGKST